jgi:hypothetical protein
MKKYYVVILLYGISLQAMDDAFLIALADGNLTCADSQLTFPNLQGGTAHLAISYLDTFVPSVRKKLERAKTKKDVQENFPELTDYQAYSMLAAHIIFIKKSDLTAFDDPRFEADIFPDFRNRKAEASRQISYVRDRLITVMSSKDAKGSETRINAKKEADIKLLLVLQMHPWNKPLHHLVLEKLESGELEQAE